MTVILKKNIRGRILDIGGGGEGIIGRLYGEQVIAIDNRQEELDEAPDRFEKRLMDAAALKFDDGTFDSVTAFYSFMFMDRKTRKNAAAEMVRVLKDGGEIHIWDTAVPDAEKEPFCTDIDIVLPEEEIHTAYGIMGDDLEQNHAGTKELFEKLGLFCEKAEENEGHFYLRLKK